MGMVSKMEGVKAETDRNSLTGGLKRISRTTSLSSPDSSRSPVRGKLRGPRSVFCTRTDYSKKVNPIGLRVFLSILNKIWSFSSIPVAFVPG